MQERVGTIAAMTDFWAGRRVIVTGGSGFLGRAVISRLDARGATNITVPRSTEYDLRRREDAARLFADVQPDLVIHLAARVGGIGANQARPADLYLDNLLMGTYVLEEARLQNTSKTVMVGTICSYPKFTPVPFHEDSLWEGYPEETQRAVRHRQAGPTGAGPGEPRAVWAERDLPDADQPVRARRQVPSRGGATSSRR